MKNVGGACSSIEMLMGTWPEKVWEPLY